MTFWKLLVDYKNLLVEVHYFKLKKWFEEKYFVIWIVLDPDFMQQTLVLLNEYRGYLAVKNVF